MGILIHKNFIFSVILLFVVLAIRHLFVLGPQKVRSTHLDKIFGLG